MAQTLEEFTEELKRDLTERMVASLKANTVAPDDARLLARDFLALLPFEDAFDMEKKLDKLQTEQKKISILLLILPICIKANIYFAGSGAMPVFEYMTGTLTNTFLDAITLATHNKTIDFETGKDITREYGSMAFFNEQDAVEKLAPFVKTYPYLQSVYDVAKAYLDYETQKQQPAPSLGAAFAKLNKGTGQQAAPAPKPQYTKAQEEVIAFFQKVVEGSTGDEQEKAKQAIAHVKEHPEDAEEILAAINARRNSAQKEVLKDIDRLRRYTYKIRVSAINRAQRQRSQAIEQQADEIIENHPEEVSALIQKLEQQFGKEYFTDIPLTDAQQRAVATIKKLRALNVGADKELQDLEDLALSNPEAGEIALKALQELGNHMLEQAQQREQKSPTPQPEQKKKWWQW